MVPMIYLSGLIFPIENMPPAIQLVTYVIPLRYYAEIIRGVFLRGSGIDVLWPEALIAARHGRRDPDRRLAALPEAAGLARARRRPGVSAQERDASGPRPTSAGGTERQQHEG